MQQDESQKRRHNLKKKQHKTVNAPVTNHLQKNNHKLRLGYLKLEFHITEHKGSATG